MQDDDRLAGGRADGRVVQAHFGKRFAGLKAEVADGPIALDRGGIIRGGGRKRDQAQKCVHCRAREQAQDFHADLRSARWQQQKSK